MDRVLVAVILCCWELGMAQQFIAVQQPQSWYDAVQVCGNQGRRLQMTFDSRPPTSDPIWLGARLVQSSWLWSDGQPLYPHEGCYSSRGLPDTANYIQNNTVSRCMLTCQKKILSPVHVLYIALQGDKCWCLDNLQGRTANKDDCSTRCDGDPQVFCGGPTAVSIYRDDRKHFPWQYAEGGDCAYLYWSFQTRASLDSVVMMTDVCDLQAVERKRFFCLQCDPSSQCSPVVNSAYMTWEKANATCRLAPVKKDDKPNFNFSVGTNEHYWIGLSRQTKWTWLNGEEVTGANAPNWQPPRPKGKCLAVAVEAGGKLTYQALPCSDPLNFVCTEDPTASVSRPSRDSSTTTRSAPTSSAFTTVSTATTASTTVSSTPTTTTTPITTTTPTTATPSTTASSAESTTSSTTLPPSTVSSAVTSTSPKPVTRETSRSLMTPATPRSTADSQTPSSMHAVTPDSATSTTHGPVASASSTPSGSTTMETYNIVPEEANYNIGLYAGLGAMGLLLIAIISVLCACVVCRRRRARRQLLYSVTENGLAGVDNSVVLAVGPDEVFTANSMYGRTEKRVRLRSLKDLELDTAIYARPFKPGKEEIVIS